MTGQIMSKDDQSEKPSGQSGTDSLCGYGRFTPQCLQTLHTPKLLLVCLCCCSIFQGMVVNGLVPVSISTIERRFDLSSTKSGVYISMYDVAILFSLVFVSYYGGKGHKGKWLGYGMMILGLGSLVCTIPQFATGPYEYEESNNKAVCSLGQNKTDECLSKNRASPVSNYFYVFLLGQLLHGFGAAPLYTLGITYLDENVSQKMSAVYNGIFFAFSVLGPAIGFILGGKLLGIYGDIGKVDLSTVTINNMDPRWYGAWWIGFIITGIGAFLISIPLLGFAKSLPGAKSKRMKDVDQSNTFGSKDESSSDFLGGNFRDLPRQCWNLLRNPTYVCVVIMQTVEGFLLNGFTNFVPKVIENLFSMSSGTASLITGCLVVPGGFLGTIIGGYLIKRLELRCPGILVLAFCAQAMTLILSFVLLVQCPEQKFAGMNSAYTLGDSLLSNNVTAQCNAPCGCTRTYNPVCAVAYGLAYYSPCHAGCTRAPNSSSVEPMYSSCSCVANYNGTGLTDSTFPATVTPGYCPLNCGANYYIFMIVFAILVLFTFISAIPIQQVILRCVPFSERTLAISLSWIFTRLIGSIPGAVLFGLAIDSACSLWLRDACTNVKKACLRYNTRDMALYILYFAIGLKLTGLSALALGRYLYRGPKVGDVEPPQPISMINTHENGNSYNGTVISDPHKSGELEMESVKL